MSKAGNRSDMQVRVVVFLLIVATVGATQVARGASEEKAWFIGVSAGRLGGGNVWQTLLCSGGITEASLAGISAGRRLGSIWEDRIAFDAEVQLLRHFRGRRYGEYTGSLVMRWLAFPWDDYLDTTFSIGEGLSYADKTPAINDSDTCRLLNYLSYELAFSLPALSSWSLVGRIHHRSGIWGTFSGVFDASNFYVTGIRYAF